MKPYNIVLAAYLLSVLPVTAEPTLDFKQLPKEVRDHAIDVRNSCQEYTSKGGGEEEGAFDDMQGIQILDLKGDGSRNIFVDNEGLCGRAMPGANCSNRGCDFRIYKEVSRGQWRKIFDEHLHDKFLAIDWDKMRLQLMIVSIYAGDPRCKPNRRKDYTSGSSCNLIVRYRNNKLDWELIR
jgi:hypothetical protein